MYATIMYASITVHAERTISYSSQQDLKMDMTALTKLHRLGLFMASMCTRTSIGVIISTWCSPCSLVPPYIKCWDTAMSLSPKFCAVAIATPPTMQHSLRPRSLLKIAHVPSSPAGSLSKHVGR